MAQLLSIAGNLGTAVFGILALITGFRDDHNRVTRRATMVMVGLATASLLSLSGNWLQGKQSEKVATSRHEQTLKSVWDETNRMRIEDISAVIRFLAHATSPQPEKEALFRENWDFILKIVEAGKKLPDGRIPPSRKGLELFKNPHGLTLIGKDHKARVLNVDGNFGQWSTYHFHRHHYQLGQPFDNWRQAESWNGAHIDAVFTAYKLPGWLKPTGFRARLVIFANGLALAKSHSHKVYPGPFPNSLVIPFPRMTISKQAFPNSPFSSQKTEDSLITAFVRVLLWVLFVGMLLCIFLFFRIRLPNESKTPLNIAASADTKKRRR